MFIILVHLLDHPRELRTFVNPGRYIVHLIVIHYSLLEECLNDFVTEILVGEVLVHLSLGNLLLQQSGQSGGVGIGVLELLDQPAGLL